VWSEVSPAVELQTVGVVERYWEGRPQGVKVPYTKCLRLYCDVPEYGGTREILPESGRTTFQG
jgi:hypothetical protein